MVSKIDFTMQDLVDSGAHFGHVREKYNPKMQSFIFGLKEGVYLIDLEKTVLALSKTLDYIKDQKEKGKNILFVCTKNGINDVVKNLAIETGMPYITYRWPGGLLTNFETLKKQIKKLEKLETMEGTAEWESLKKKERSVMNKEKEKLLKSFEGVKKLTKVPDNIFIVDTIMEKTALREAKKIGIPVIAVLDTNSDPIGIAYPIPANDDAKKAVELILGEIKKALE
ncbi:MAG TPA: 30S ribosomal protein S2 [Patescibacteria group bacterium]|nr:30S ribosomal protein S2 [Patescibacteria group bacterium]